MRPDPRKLIKERYEDPKERYEDPKPTKLSPLAIGMIVFFSLIVLVFIVLYVKDWVKVYSEHKSLVDKRV